VPPHDLTNPREIGRSARRFREDGRNLLEILGAEQSRGDDAKGLRANVAAVVEINCTRFARGATADGMSRVGLPDVRSG
jgi:hypothetical protein